MTTHRIAGLLLRAWPAVLTLLVLVGIPTIAFADASGGHQIGGEANLSLPDLASTTMLGTDGRTLLFGGMGVCALGLMMGLAIFAQLRGLPVHQAMKDISELIYETCKTYLLHAAEVHPASSGSSSASIMGYWVLRRVPRRKLDASRPDHVLAGRHRRQLRRGVVRHPREHLRQLAHRVRRLRGKPFPVYAIPLQAGMSIGMLLISTELFLMLSSCCSFPATYAGPCFIGFAIGESLGASALRIAGGIFTKIADIGSDLMKIVFKIKEDDARNPGVIADCTGDNAGDSVGPSADGFETYGVTGVALISSSCSPSTPPTRSSCSSGSSSCAW
jgi:K(+)-stimulated pyrophosphate-energized sodium pump